MSFSTSSTLSAERPSEAPARVLVVEDEVSIRRIESELLTDEGYEVRTAEDGAEALNVLEEWTPDAILLDLSMPRMDGRAFLREWRARRDAERVPVIVLSASHGINESELRVERVIPKPFEIDDVLQTLRDCLVA